MMRAHISATHESAEAEFSDHGTIVTSWSALAAEVELLAGRPDHAEAILAASVDALKAGGDAGWLATNTAWLAEALYRQGRFEAALQLSTDAQSVSPPGYLTSLSIAGRVRAKSLARAGRHDEAQTLALESVEWLARPTRSTSAARSRPQPPRSSPCRGTVVEHSVGQTMRLTCSP